jgi:hypothetical protein
MPNPKYFKGAKLRAYTAGLIDADEKPFFADDIRDDVLATVLECSTYADAGEADFRRGFIAGWAGRSNAEDGDDYVKGYESGQECRKNAAENDAA